jgi:hypothetical protein
MRTPNSARPGVRHTGLSLFLRSSPLACGKTRSWRLRSTDQQKSGSKRRARGPCCCSAGKTVNVIHKRLSFAGFVLETYITNRLVLQGFAQHRNAADGSDFPPIETGYATDWAPAGQSPKAASRAASSASAGAESALHEHRGAFAVEKLQAKIRRVSGRDFVDGRKALRFG